VSLHVVAGLSLVLVGFMAAPWGRGRVCGAVPRTDHLPQASAHRMDPITHTLTGGALAGTGLRRISPGATATLILASNAPDVDALAYFGDPYWALAFRRGITHGPLGMVLLPPLVVGAVLLWHRWRRGRGERPGGFHSAVSSPSGSAGPAPPRPGALLGLALLGVVVHQLMDWTNSYGTRFWEPFSSRWSYLDALFIVDPWLWVLLGGGLLLAWRWGERWARLGGAGALAYILFMVSSSALARAEVRNAWEGVGMGPVVEIMAAPAPLNPLARSVVVETGEAYHLGRFSWLQRPRVRFEAAPLPKLHATTGSLLSPWEAVEAARQDPSLRDYLVWSRFPHFQVVPLPGGGAEVRVGDARFTGFRGAGSLSGLRVEVQGPLPETGAP
jgi:inner membrane protein